MAAHLKYKSGNSWIDYNLVVYPVGALYISYLSTSPASLFGGTWTPITGRFPYFNAGTSPGGSNTKTVNFNHTHRQTDKFTTAYQTGGNGYQYTNGGTQTNTHIATGDSAWSGGEGASIGTKLTLGNKTIDVMPAYQTFYAWRRTA